MLEFPILVCYDAVMADNHPLTKAEFLAALKESGVVTKDDVRQIVNQSLLDFWEKVLEPSIATKEDLQTVNDQLTAGQKEVQRQVNDLKIDAPTKQEFETLKQIVDSHLLAH